MAEAMEKPDYGDDVFNDSVSKSVEVEKEDVVAPEPEEKEADEADAAEVEVSKEEGEEEEAQVVSEDSDDLANVKSVPVAALKSERQKRQELEKRLKEYQEKEASNIPVPDKEEDPEGYEFHLKLTLSRDLMAEVYSDYAEKATVFQKIAANNPLLLAQFQKHPYPAKFAYETAKQHLELENYKEATKSPDWKEFQEWKKQKSEIKAPKEETESELRKKAALSVPNLTKLTSKKAQEKDSQEDVFDGAIF